jgi:hypothetical protein
MIKYLIERYLVKALCEEIKNCLLLYSVEREYQICKDGDCYTVFFKSTIKNYDDNSETITRRKLKIYPRQILFLRQENIDTMARYIDGKSDKRVIY